MSPPKKQLNAAATDMFFALEELLAIKEMDRHLGRELNMPMATPLAQKALADARRAYQKAGGTIYVHAINS